MEWWILAVIVLAVMALIANVADIETTVACARKFGADGEANPQGRNLMKKHGPGALRLMNIPIILLNTAIVSIVIVENSIVVGLIVMLAIIQFIVFKIGACSNNYQRLNPDYRPSPIMKKITHAGFVITSFAWRIRLRGKKR